MNRDQACGLWFSTLDLGPVDADPASRSRLEALWTGAGLLPGQREPLLEAVALPDRFARRFELVRRTRLCIGAAGFDPALLSTPAATMRGL